jgi:outer membrane protein
LDFSADHYKNGFPNQGLSNSSLNQNTVGISLTIPLFEGFARSYKVRGAQALAEQKAGQLQDTEQSVLMGVIKAHADAQATLDNLDAAQLLLSAAQESLQTSQRRYDRGAADMVELLGAQAALSDAQQEHVRSRADWRSAKLKLLASAGVMGRVPGR